MTQAKSATGESRGRRGWVTLLTQPNYLVGVRALNASLRGVGSRYPLVVMVTADIDDDSRRLLADDGCLIREVEPVRPVEDDPEHYANARFAEVWTKLAVWRLTEFDRVVFLDADMLLIQDMDELFDLGLAEDQIAACHACRCNPNKIASYPASWRPENCFYTQLESQTMPDEADDYLNGGLLVLRPDQAVYDELMVELATVTDLSRYPFAEQDFLNEHFRGRWQPLPYVYNALKTLPFQHPGIWDADAVKNIHYIIDKPWQQPLDPDDRYYPLTRLWWQTAADLMADASS